MDPNLKQRIIDEAYKLFITKGIEQTTFCDVAEAVCKSKGAVMYYFHSKKQLIDTVVKMCFFPASELSNNMSLLFAEKEWSDFIKIYKNPIERAIISFPKSTEGNQLMYYMQFISAANKYMDDFPHLYQSLLAQEECFILSIVKKAISSHKITVQDARSFTKQTLNMSIGKTFSNLLLKL